MYTEQPLAVSAMTSTNFNFHKILLKVEITETKNKIHNKVYEQRSYKQNS